MIRELDASLHASAILYGIASAFGDLPIPATQFDGWRAQLTAAASEAEREQIAADIYADLTARAKVVVA